MASADGAVGAAEMEVDAEVGTAPAPRVTYVGNRAQLVAPVMAPSMSEEVVSSLDASNAMAEEADAAMQAEAEQCQRDNFAPLDLHTLFRDLRPETIPQGGSLRGLLVKVVSGEAMVNDRSMRALAAEALHQHELIAARLKEHSETIESQGDTIKSLEHRLGVLENRFGGKPADLDHNMLRTVCTLTGKFAGGSADDFEVWGEKCQRVFEMLKLDALNWAACAETQLTDKAAQRWRQIREEELKDVPHPTWQQFQEHMSPMFAQADREAKAVAKWEAGLALKTMTVLGVSAYARELQDTVRDMGIKKPSMSTAWSAYKKGLPGAWNTVISMAEASNKATNDNWTRTLASMIAEATGLLHTLINDSAPSSVGAGVQGAGQAGQSGGQGGGGKKRGRDAGAPSAQPPAKRQAAGKGGAPLSDADFTRLAGTHVAFRDPSEAKPFSQELLSACRARDACLFCTRSGHRMFDCPDLNEDPARKKRLRDAAQKCAPSPCAEAHDQTQTQVQPCNALVMSAGPGPSGTRPNPRPEEVLPVVNLQTLARYEPHPAIMSPEVSAQPLPLKDTGDVLVSPNAGGTDSTHSGTSADDASPADREGNPEAIGEADQDSRHVHMRTVDPCIADDPGCEAKEHVIDSIDVPGTSCTYADRVNATEQSILGSQYHAIENLTRPFTRDGFAATDGHNALCNDFGSLPSNPFQCMDHRGHHIWINAPFRDLKWVLEHYLRAKALAPESTSACFLVPFWRKRQVSGHSCVACN